MGVFLCNRPSSLHPRTLGNTMKKLHLDALTIDSFATTASEIARPGTVHGHQQRSLGPCPESWNGTCYITCAADTPCPIRDTEGC